VLRGLLGARGAPGTRHVPPESELEARLYRLVDSSDLPKAERQYAIGQGTRSWRTDLAFVEERVVVEVDGYAFHAGREAWEADRARDNAMTRRGWRVLRFTWTDLQRRPDHVLAVISETLGQNAR
jgi:very-short-patch-repair endonuclease